MIVFAAQGERQGRLTNADRWFFVQLYRWFPSILEAFTIIRPETLLRWHRLSSLLALEITATRRAGLQVRAELRPLIRQMSVGNPLWSVPRIHGELLKLGFEVSQSSVAKYMVKRRGPPSQGWRAFLRNHAPISPRWICSLSRLWCKFWKVDILPVKAPSESARIFMQSIDDLFKGRYFEWEIIILCVRWYLRFKLSFRDLAEMMAERGIDLAYTTILHWIQRYVPEVEKRWDRFACNAGGSWRVDETYVKIKGRWTYLYSAVDSNGKTVDFLLRAKRDVAAATAFFCRAFESQRTLLRAITLDGYQASHGAAREFLATHRRGDWTKLRSSKYLNNRIEQDHRSIKLRLGPVLGFKRFRHALITIACIELVHRIRKG